MGDTSKVYVVKMPAESESVLENLKDTIKKYPNVKVDLDLYDLPTTSLPEDCFYFDDCLPNVVGLILPQKLKRIELGACDGLSNLTDLYLPETLEYIGEWGIERCSSLTAVTLPPSLKEIDKSAFLRCKNLKTVTLRNGIKEIEPYAFQDCPSLTAIDIPGSVKKIGDSAFYNCKNLERVTLHDGLEEIGEFAFAMGDDAENRTLTSIDIPQTVKKISYQTFRKCYALKNVTLHEGLETISALAFHMTGIESITIPSTVTHIADEDGNIFYKLNPFAGCNSLKKITVAAGNKYFKEGADGCLYTIDGKYLITYPNGRPETTFTVPANVNIRDRAFYEKGNLRELIIEAGTDDVSIGMECFAKTAITTVTIPANVTRIAPNLCRWDSSVANIIMQDTTSRWKKIQLDSNGNDIGFTEVTFTADAKANKAIFAEENYRFEKIVD